MQMSLIFLLEETDVSPIKESNLNYKKQIRAGQSQPGMVDCLRQNHSRRLVRKMQIPGLRTRATKPASQGGQDWEPEFLTKFPGSYWRTEAEWLLDQAPWSGPHTLNQLARPCPQETLRSGDPPGASKLKAEDTAGNGGCFMGL